MMTPVGVTSHCMSFRATGWLVLPKILLPFPRTIGMVSRLTRDPQMLGPQPNLARNAVLTHRPGELLLDNAFTLIEGHPHTVAGAPKLLSHLEFAASA